MTIKSTVLIFHTWVKIVLHDEVGRTNVVSVLLRVICTVVRTNMQVEAVP